MLESPQISDERVLTTSRAQSIVWLVGVLAVLLLVAVGMRMTAAQKISPYVPLWADQVQYLTEAYRGYELIRQHGLVAGTVEAVRQPRPQGWLPQTLASLTMQFVGPGRLGALDVNLAMLLLWLGVTSYAVKRAFGISASAIALGLMLSTAIVLKHPGGPFDFRLDFSTMCLWGILVVLVAVAGGRIGWGSGVAILLVGFALIANRFISLTYLVPFGGLVAILGIAMDWQARRGWRRLWSPMIPIVALWATLAVVILILNYDLFQGYYVRGHVTGEEPALRRLQVGISTLRDDLLFYPRTVIREQLSRSFQVPATIVLLLSLAAGLLAWRPAIWPWKSGGASEGEARAVPTRALVWFLAVAVLALVACYLPLTAAQQKSWVVSGPFITPVVLLVVGVGQWLSRATWDDHPFTLARLGFRLLGPIIVVAALLFQWQRIQAGVPGLPPARDLQAYAQIVDDATPYFVAAQGRPLTWSMDGHYVEIASTTVQVFTFERTGVWINLPGGLGHGAMEQTFDEASLLQFAGRSDFLLLAKRPPGTRVVFPSDQSVLDQHDVLERYAQAEMTLVDQYEIQGTPFFLYVRTPAAGSAPAG